MYRLSKSFWFEAGHRLAKGYEGKCKNMHGHSWKLTVTVEGAKLNQYGMLIDFADLKKIVNPIVDRYDHSFLVYDKDKETIKKLEGHRKVTMKENPTSEYLAMQIAMGVSLKMPKGVRVYCVTIDETRNSSRSYYPFEHEKI